MGWNPRVSPRRANSRNRFSQIRFRFFPGTGFIDEVGVGEGQGYTINVPLPAGTGDETYMSAFRELVPPLIRNYKPEIILNQFGVDGHYDDPLVGLSLTTNTYKQVASILHGLSHETCGGRYLVLGGEDTTWTTSLDVGLRCS